MIERPKFRIEPLDVVKHRREEFDCGVPELTKFLRERARKEMQSKTSACFVAVPIADAGKIAGYYTLSAATVALAQLPAELVKRLPRYSELPATLLGRLARDLAFRSEGIGDYLLTDALRRALSNTIVIGSVAVVTDPKDERAAAFYRRYGFRAYDSQGKRLLLSMAEIASFLEERGCGLKQLRPNHVSPVARHRPFHGRSRRARRRQEGFHELP